MAEATTMAETDVQAGAPTSTNPLGAFVNGIKEHQLLAARRRQAWTTYETTPMPTRRSEEWRYTDITGLAPERFSPPGHNGGQGAAAELPHPIRDALQGDHERSAVLVQRNGFLERAQIEDDVGEAGVVLASIAEVAAKRPELLERYLYASSVAEMERKLWSLHAALLTGGYVLYVPANVRLARPVHCFRYLDQPSTIVSTHSLIVAEPGAELVCIDEYLSPDLDGEALSLNGVEIFGSEQSIVRYLSIQRYGAGVKHFSMQHVNTGRDSRMSGCNVSLGGDLARADVTSHLEGAGAESEMLALWLGDENQHFDHHTLQHHEAPNAHSDLLYKGALTGSARSVFRGLIRVNPGAQLTDAYQTNRNLLLSPDAHATTLPNLEIEADDVRCSHGATVGQVDAGQLFYLMNRGLDRRQAERLLVLGFFQDVLGRIPAEGVRDRVRQAIEQKVGV